MQIGGAEITNPLLQTRWFLRETGQYAGPRALLVDTLFAFTFGLSRLGFGTWLLVVTLRGDATHWFLKCGAVVLYSISVLWFVAILGMYRRRYLRGKAE